MFLVFTTASFSAQAGFFLQNNKKKAKIPLRLVNNLPIVPVEINGTKLSFILDTGVNSTILFSLEEADSIQLFQTSHVQLQGLGPGGSVAAIKSVGNTVKVGNVLDNDHGLFIIFESVLNFSPRMGIPIHGILGNEFFRNFIVKINYSTQKITVYDPKRYSLKACRKCEDLPLKFVGNKPYINLQVISDHSEREATLLVDSGSSDVLWLFEEEEFIQESPKNYFNDFLGLGLSGNIFGKRARISGLKIGQFLLEEVSASFPEEDAINQARYFQDRDGSVGGGFLSRFTVTFDYGDSLVRFKKNRRFKEPFHYNMSGLTIEHEGMELVRQEKQALVNSDRVNMDQAISRNSISVVTEFKFTLVPRYVVVDVRDFSPAAEAGIQKGDEILSINGKPIYQFKLFELIDMFSREEGKRISMEIKRGAYVSKVRFYLKSLF
ncbi:MAG: aspartyl protease family protein [Aequorivita sp.]